MFPLSSITDGIEAMETLQRVLHIEDDESIRSITRVALETVGGLQVESCGSGAEGLQRFATFRPQLVLLDVMMPELDGPDTLAGLQNQYDLSETLIVFMTAKVQEQEIDHYLAIGAHDVIFKPFDPMSLSEQLQRCWQQHRAVQ